MPVLTFEIKVTWYFLEMNKQFHILCHSVAGSKIMKQIRSGVTFDLGFINANTTLAVAWSLGHKEDTQGVPSTEGCHLE